jgi:hypothetical protein
MISLNVYTKTLCNVRLYSSSPTFLYFFFADASICRKSVELELWRLFHWPWRQNRSRDYLPLPVIEFSAEVSFSRLLCSFLFHSLSSTSSWKFSRNKDRTRSVNTSICSWIEWKNRELYAV